MSESETNCLPSGWIYASVDDCFSDIRNGTTATQNKQGIGLPVSRIECVQNGCFVPERVGYIEKSDSLTQFAYQMGDLAFSHINSMEHVGKVSIYKGYPSGLLHGMNLLRLRSNQTFLNPQFASYQMNSRDFRSSVRAIAHMSVNQVSVNQANLRSLFLVVPPLAEQQRIVAEIEKQFSRLDAGVAVLKKVQANLKRYRAAVLRAACEGRLVPTEAALALAEGRAYEPADVLLSRILVERRARWEAEQLAKMEAQGRLLLNDTWRAKYQEPAAPDRSNQHNVLPPLTDGWIWVRAEQITRRITDGTHQPPEFVEKGVPFVFVKHIVGGKISFQNTNFISEDTYRRLNARCPVEMGDVLYTAVGSYGVAVPVLTTRPFSFQRHIAHIKPERLIAQSYLVHCLNSPVCLKQAHTVAKGVAQKTVTLGDLTNYSIPLPPLAEQERIVAEVERRLSVVDGLEAVVAANLKRAERLRQAILQRAFAGQLVPQDPNDEPASLLLERIRAERAAPANGAKPANRRAKKPEETSLELPL